MDYVARIVRKDGTVTEQPVATQQAGNQWLSQNSRDGDRGASVMKKK